MLMRIFEPIWASTFIWFLEPVPQNRTPWHFWTRLVLWTPIVYGLILPICAALVLSAISAMFIYDGFWSFFRFDPSRII
jgi:hypothetical protein